MRLFFRGCFKSFLAFWAEMFIELRRFYWKTIYLIDIVLSWGKNHFEFKAFLFNSFLKKILRFIDFLASALKLPKYKRKR